MALTQTQVSQLYVSIFGRASEGAGNTYWQTTADMATAANTMLATDAAATYFGTSLATDLAFVKHIYLNTLGKTYEQDTAGVDGWVTYLATHTRGEMVAALVYAAQQPANAGAAQDMFNNKVTVSNYCADNIETADVADLSAFTGYISSVTSDAATVTAAKATIIHNSNPGSTFTLTTGTDSFVGTAKNDTFTSAAGTLATADTILDSSATDTDVLTAEVSAYVAGTTPRIQNVETINVNGKYVSTGLALSSVSGTQNLNLNTAIVGGTATVIDASSLNALNINAGDNIATLSVTATASGTRDTVYVDANDAATVTVAGGAGADAFDVTLAAGATATFNGGGSVDAYTVNVGSTATLTGHTSTEAVTINAAANSVVTLGGVLTDTVAVVSTAKTTIAGAGNVTLKTVTANVDGTSIVKSGTGTFTLQITDDAAGDSYKKVLADVVKLTAANTGTVTVNGNSTVNLSENVNGTINVDNAGTTAMAAGEGTLIVKVSDAQGTGITVGANVGTVILEATPDEVVDLDLDENGTEETSMGLTALSINAATGVVVAQGAENLSIATINVTAADQVITASTMTGKLSIGAIAGAFDNITIVGGKGDDTIVTNAVQIYDVQTGDGADTINIANAKAGSEVTAGAGNDTITSSANAVTIDAGTGDDTVTTAGSDTITLGTGSDNVKLGTNQASVKVKDFVKGTDKVTLLGTAAAAIDLSDMTVVSGVYKIADANGTLAANEWHIELENGGSDLTATDMRDSIALSGVTLIASSTNILGNFADTVVMTAGTVTTGTGADTVTVAAALAANATVTVKDFTIGTDKMIITSAISDDLSVNLKNVTDVAGKYTIGDATLGANFTLQNGGSNIVTEGDLTGIVQLGASATSTFAVNAATADVTVTGSSFNDFITIEAAATSTGAETATFVFSNNGGVDTVVFAGTTAANELVSFNSLTGIDSTAAKVALGTNAAKVADATNKGVYVFADSSDGTGSADITTFVVDTANGYTQDVINAEVAAFINAGLGVSAGEKYVVVINDQSTATYETTAYGTATAYNYDSYVYLVTGDADGVQADNITLIGMIDDADGVAGSLVVTTASIA